MQYCVITLDLINSRHMHRRSEVQEELKKVLCTVNAKYQDYLQVPFAFTLGDEMQGVLAELPKSYELIREFQRLLLKHHFYAGVGYGDITTQFSERSSEMDGPAFYHARDAINELKKEYGKSGTSNPFGRFLPLVRYVFPDPQLTYLVNHYLHLLELLKFNLTDKQKEVYWLLFELNTYSEIADRLKQSKSAITQKIQAGYIDRILAGEQAFIQLLNWFQSKLLN